MLKAKFETKNKRYKEALTIYKKCMAMFKREISLIFNFNYIEKSSMARHNSKVKASVTTLIIIIMNKVKIYEYFEKITKVIELTQLGYWFLRKFISQQSEMFTMYTGFKMIIDDKYRSMYLSKENIIHVLLHTAEWWNLHVEFNQPGDWPKKAKEKLQKDTQEIKPHIKAKKKIREILSMQNFIIQGKKKPMSIFLKGSHNNGDYYDGEEDEKNELGDVDIGFKNQKYKLVSKSVDNREISNSVKLEYSRCSTGLVHKVLSNDVDSYIPRNKIEKAKNHFHERVTKDEKVSNTINDHFLSEKEYLKIQNFTKALLVERFGAYYTLLKLEQEKPQLEWVKELEDELAEDTQHISQLYGFLHTDQLEILRKKAEK